jgi:hypothetical protein
MELDQLNEIALALEAEELIGSDGEMLTANDIFPVLEVLHDRQIDIISAFDIEVAATVEPEIEN